jgi:hypothetical protein
MVYRTDVTQIKTKKLSSKLDIQTSKQIEKLEEEEKQANRQKDKQINRQKDKQTNR